MEKTIPPLDDECDILSINHSKLCFGGGETVREAFERIEEDDSKALEIRYHDERVYVRHDSSVYQTVEPPSHTSHVHLVSDLINDNVTEVAVVPVCRCPVWGDGSLWYRCENCRKPIVESERIDTFDGGLKSYHEVCVPPHLDN